MYKQIQKTQFTNKNNLYVILFCCYNEKIEYNVEVARASRFVAELGRALTGWKSPQDRSGLSFLNEEYYPGDINFDPLGLKPEDPAEFREMATKEIQNGRLAMLAIAGFVAQELVDGKPILLNDFGI